MLITRVALSKYKNRYSATALTKEYIIHHYPNLLNIFKNEIFLISQIKEVDFTTINSQQVKLSIKTEDNAIHSITLVNMEDARYIKQYINEKKGLLPIKSKKTIEFSVAGVTFEDRQKTLYKFASFLKKENNYSYYSGYTINEMKEYGGDFEQYEEFEFGEYLQFISDPDNKYDKNAVKVVAKTSENELSTIGFIPKDLNIKYLRLLEKYEVDSVIAIFNGGKIKKVVEHFDEDDLFMEKSKISVKEFESTLGVTITINFTEK